MKNWHILRLIALILSCIGSMLCLFIMYDEIRSYIVLRDLAFLTGKLPPPP